MVIFKFVMSVSHYQRAISPVFASELMQLVVAETQAFGQVRQLPLVTARSALRLKPVL